MILWLPMMLFLNSAGSTPNPQDPTYGFSFSWEDINFPTNRHEVGDGDQALTCLATLLVKNPGYKTHLLGYTDGEGSPDHNQTLAKKRIESVSKFLLGLGVNGAQIKPFPHGMNHPQFNNETHIGRFRNRRVAIQVFNHLGQPISQESVCGRKRSEVESIRNRVVELKTQGFEPRFLVTLVPDPVDSNFARTFDIFLASIIQAVSDYQKLDYILDRHYLPWQSGSVSGKGSENKGRNEPGYLIFRATNEDKPGEDRSLVILLVGETPVWGVQQQAAYAALDEAFRGSDVKDETLTLNILGPVFSGGARSMGETVKLWVGERAGLGLKDRGIKNVFLNIVSGTANSPKYGRTLDQDIFKDPIGDIKIENMATTMATGSRALHKYLWCEVVDNWLNIDPDKVVVLAESSAFGKSFSKDVPNWDSGFCVKGLKNAQVYYFPMNISRLRTEYDKELAQLRKKQKDNGLGNGSELKNLSLSLGNYGQTRDDLPHFDPMVTSRSQDLFLAKTMKAIEQKRIQAVVIIATNAMDKLFLAKMLSTHAPGVRLITFEGDLLYVHPDFNQATRGMIVLSTNPLSRREDNSDDREFVSDRAFGVYRAMKQFFPVVLKGKDNIEENARNFVYAAVAGNGGMVPAQSHEVKQDVLGPKPQNKHKRVKFESNNLSTSKVPRRWTFLFLIISIAILMFTGALLIDLYTQKRRSGATQTLSLLTKYRLKIYRRNRYLLFFILFLAIAYQYAFFIIPILKSEQMLLKLLGFLIIGIVILALSYFLWTIGAVAFQKVRESFSRSQDLPRFRGVNAVLAFVVCVALLLGFGGLVWYTYRILYQNNHFLERAIAFDSGVTPLIPLLLFPTVIASWIVFSLYRQPMIDLAPDPKWLRDFPEDGSLAVFCRDLRMAVRLSPMAFFTHLKIWCFLLIIPMLYLYLYYHKGSFVFIYGIEEGYFNLLVSVLFLIAVVLSIGSGVSSLRLWFVLQGILQWLGTNLEMKRLIERMAELFKQENFFQLKSRRAEAFKKYMKFLDETDPDSLGYLAPAVENVRTAYEEGDKKAHTLSMAWLLAGRMLYEQDRSQVRRFGRKSRFQRLKAMIRKKEEPASRDEQLPFTADVRNEPFIIDFFAYQTAWLVKEMIGIIMNFITMMTLGLVLLLLGILSYPFEPKHMLLLYLGFLLIAGIGASLYLVVHLERHPVISGLYGTDPNVINWDRIILGKILFYGGIPLVGVLTSMFPEVGEFAMRILMPLINSLG